MKDKEKNKMDSVTIPIPVDNKNAWMAENIIVSFSDKSIEKLAKAFAKELSIILNK